MTYDAIVKSVDLSQPFELYRFQMSSHYWLYNNTTEKIIHNAQTYIPYTISRSDIESSNDVSLGGISVKVPASDQIATLYLAAPPSEKITLTVFSSNFFDSQFRVIWKGRILSCEWDSDGYATLTCESIFSSQQRAGLRRRCNKNCEFKLFGPSCGVSEIGYKVNAPVLAQLGNTVTLGSLPTVSAGYFVGGEIRWPSIYNTRNSTNIKAYDPATGKFTLSTYPYGLAAGMTVEVLPGCDHTYAGVDGCLKYNNQNRYGGMNRLPDANKNPFGGESAF